MGLFSDKISIVTGAASGIGKSVSEEMARRGANVILADINENLANDLADSIKDAGGIAKSVVLDVTDHEAVKKLVDDTVTEHGRLDYIFNNAGIGVGGEVRDVAYEDWKKVIDINLYGVVNGVTSAYPVMAKQGFGHIINTASVAGLVPLAMEISYVTSKFGVVGLSNALRVERAALGVKVSVVCPGAIETPIYRNSKMVNMDREKVLKSFTKISMPVEKCARVILRGVEKNKATIVVTMHAKLMWYLQRISPLATEIIGKIIIKKVRKDLRLKDTTG